MKKYFGYLTILTLFLASCAKEIIYPEGTGPGGKFVPPTATSLLTNTYWKISASVSTVDYGSGMVFDFDLFALMPPCSLDDILIFKPNGIYGGDFGATKCDPSEVQTSDVGTWKLSDDKKKLSIVTTVPNPYLNSLEAEVLELSEQKLIIRYTTYLNGPASTTTTSYTRVK